MVSRTGLSIRRLISQRKPRTDYVYDDGGYGRNEGFIQGWSANDKDGLMDPWMAKRQIGHRKLLTAPIIVNGTQSVDDILRNPLPPLPEETPRSSASSLSSRGPRSRSETTLCSRSSKENWSEESLQMADAHDDDVREQVPRISTASPNLIHHDEGWSDSTPETSEISPEDESKPSDYLRPGKRTSFATVSENVQQLIREADEAFKAVGIALNEIRLIEPAITSIPRSATPDEPPPPPAKDIVPQTPQTQDRQNTTAPNTPSAKVAAPPGSPKRVPLTYKVKRKKSKKSKRPRSMKPQRKTGALRPAAKSGPRWTISDNVSELLTGKLFHKIEADEMLTPDQVEAWRLRRLSILQAQAQAKQAAPESSDNDTIDTPVEPFHLEDLSRRIGSSGLRLGEDSITTEGRTSFGEVVRQDVSSERTSGEWPLNSSAANAVEQRPTIHKNNTFPTPILTHPQRTTLLRQQPTALSSIPEVSSASTPRPRDDDELFLGGELTRSPVGVTDSEYVFFQSTPHSVNMPTYRHGPIRLAKEDLMPDLRDAGLDDGLDWTAFQMAISGGAGDWLTDSDDTIRRREAEEIQDIVDWFAGYDFDGPGALVYAGDVEVAPTSPTISSITTTTTTTSGGEEFSDVSYTNIEQDNPYSPHHKWQQHHNPLQRRRSQYPRHSAGPRSHHRHASSNATRTSTLREDRASSKYYVDSEIEQWNSSQHQKQQQQASTLTVVGGGREGGGAGGKQPPSGRESYSSMPQSPMLDLRVIRSGEGGDDLDVVPMGYNLGHDLGDFLKWEAEHVYAGDF
ncbi:hypothetical protein F4778DRAFT_749114 [Xylariomycetidae sp. FL2044]|nr:hypothetical protein F4778DRAFT_749114 [Xylariomycetidae sp. FL2044]